MYCRYCGKEIDDKAVICPGCGCAVATEEPKKPENKVNVLGLVGFIFSIVSLFLSLWGAVAIAGLVCSIIGLVQCVKNGGGLKGFPIAGISVSAVSLVYTFYAFLLSGVF